ncbi:class I SAM-dependent methyltransferase [Shewanella intestini]|uniref:Class I SAM-dependent methyltransferase n=1 Tax=Shewanella intestini TaxID=2017544 RepID=A0ABS5I3X4_9GAMM|nr:MULTISPECIES: class I SAM-dependent methyltransferase [Shewanella]MBR9728728.1 class I SAM-dependent methyltransferase [Shewanella intestini]MRG36804.1 methyltransferase domain-containing protein [Shewanella sp. XMDDZSB0408]
MPTCPLCLHENLDEFHQDKHRQYWQCPICDLVSVPASFHLSADAEKAVYDLHDNAFADEGYQRFLSRTLTPLLQRVPQDAVGLDFGCGEGAVLSHMAAKQGVKVHNYDLYYHPFAERLTGQYDFICLTEVIEHIYDAHGLIEQLTHMLKPGGILAVMTKRVLGHAEFIHWHYKNDPTHINFYSQTTFEWIAKQHDGWQCEVIDKDVVFITLA